MELRHDEVLRMTGMSLDTLRKREKNGEFPKRFKIDKRHVRWHSDEVEEWIKEHGR